MQRAPKPPTMSVPLFSSSWRGDRTHRRETARTSIFGHCCCLELGSFLGHYEGHGSLPSLSDQVVCE